MPASHADDVAEVAMPTSHSFDIDAEATEPASHADVSAEAAMPASHRPDTGAEAAEPASHADVDAEVAMPTSHATDVGAEAAMPASHRFLFCKAVLSAEFVRASMLLAPVVLVKCATVLDTCVFCRSSSVLCCFLARTCAHLHPVQCLRHLRHTASCCRRDVLVPVRVAHTQ